MVQDPGKVLVDLDLAVARGGDRLADVGILQAEPDVFGPVASDPTVSRLVRRSRRRRSQCPGGDPGRTFRSTDAGLGAGRGEQYGHLRRGQQSLIRTDSASGTHAFVDWLSRPGR